MPNNLGDVIMTTPVLEGLKKKYPLSHITFFVETGFEGGIALNPYIDEIFHFNRKDIKKALSETRIKTGSLSLIKIINRLKRKKFDLLINLSQHDYISIMIPLLKAKHILGRHFLTEGNDSISDKWSHYLYSIPFAREFNSLHSIDVYRRIVQIQNYKCRSCIKISEEEKCTAVKTFNDLGIDITSNKIIFFQAGAAFPSKRWPIYQFIKLGRMLIDKDWHIILSGSPFESDITIEIQKKLGKNCYNIAGKTSFRQTIAMLTFAQTCVTGDTALMHASAAVKVKTITLFGATNPVETGPYGKNHIILSGSCDKKPCFKRECESMQCMNTINPEYLYHLIEKKTFSHTPSCDVFITSFTNNNDFILKPVNSKSCLYFNSNGAIIAQRVFDNTISHYPTSQSNYYKINEDSQKFLSLLNEMEQILSSFLIDSKNMNLIHTFENKKVDLDKVSGIGKFWNAYLNLQLNSIPILNPLKAVLLSRQVCLETKNRILTALGVGC
jgi:ADP-heptose:LPS heptosyltransferase